MTVVPAVQMSLHEDILALADGVRFFKNDLYFDIWANIAAAWKPHAN